MPVETNPNYIHHKDQKIGSIIRELVFGLEDGMVSTLGSITGIAAATKDPFTVVLAGFVIVAVESISMAVGSYLSSKSERAIDDAKMEEERMELKKFPTEEKEELVEMYVKDGWSPDLALVMAEEASQNKKLFLQEMAYRELKIIPDNMENPLRNGVVMGFSYIVGGAIPLVPYLILPVPEAILWSLAVTPVGLFALGAFTTKFSKRPWWQAGLEMLLLASAAAAVGYGVGQLVDGLWLKKG